MSKSRPLVALGFLGTRLDSIRGDVRWQKWRPSVALCQQPELPVARLELLRGPHTQPLFAQVREDVRKVSPHTEVRDHVLTIEDPWDFELVYAALHDFVRAQAFAPEREDYLVHLTTGTHVQQICLFLLTESRHLPGRLVQTAPSREHGPKGRCSVIDLDLSRYDKLASRFAREKSEGQSLLKAGIETRNEGFNKLIARIELVAGASRAPMLLTGPTGAGKSQLARRIYELKRARHQVRGPFAELNCATLRGDLASSTLFGHTRGAFTGASAPRAGLLEKAHEGVLFLDEIGELGLDEQALLLRALEDKVYTPVGSDQEKRSDFQLLAGTNRELLERVREGAFRQDLLARINLWSFRLPGLRERPEDLAPNLEHELEKATQLLGARVTFSREAQERYLRFAASREALWTGNFRDLNGSVTRMATLAQGARISVADVEEELERLRAQWSSPEPERPAEDLVRAHLGPERAGELDLFDRVQLAEVLRVCAAARSLSDAGRVLFAASRARKSTSNDADRLRKYLARFELRFEELRGE